ncbi:MAG: single-stranded DNA-binding protein [Planctomycetota bacterium]|jgi:single-strand DNA-binding protein
MAGFNKVLLMGNLTRDPQLSYTPNQTAVVDFGIAVNRRWKGQDGNQREETCFADCRAFGRMAENINKYLSKGRPVFVEGRLTLDSWTAQDGTKRSKHRVTVENFQFLPGGAGSGAGEGQTRMDKSDSQTTGTSFGAEQEVGADDIPF